MENREHPNLSFSGCGFLGIYHVGVGSCMREHCPQLIENAKKIFGCSAGSIFATALVGGVCMGDACEDVIGLVKDARSRVLGPLHPGFRLVAKVRDMMERMLPPDCYVRCNGKLHISLTRVSDGTNYLASHFESNADLIDAVICSCFIPFYCGIVPPKYRNEYYIDGGMSNNLPKDGVTISVQPWQGNADICPADEYTKLSMTLAHCNIDVTPDNFKRFYWMLFPSTADDVSGFCRRGFHDCYDFLSQNGYIEKTPKLARRMTFTGEWYEAQQRRSVHEKVKKMERALRDFYTSSLDCTEMELELEVKDKTKDLITTIKKLNTSYENTVNIFEEDVFESIDEGDIGGSRYNSEKPQLPRPVTKSLSRAQEDKPETCMLQYTKSLVKLPLELCGDSFTNWKEHAQNGILFGFDMTVRQLHKNGLIDFETAHHVFEQNNPKPTIAQMDY